MSAAQRGYSVFRSCLAFSSRNVFTSSHFLTLLSPMVSSFQLLASSVEGSLLSLRDSMNGDTSCQSGDRETNAATWSTSGTSPGSGSSLWLSPDGPGAQMVVKTAVVTLLGAWAEKTCVASRSLLGLCLASLARDWMAATTLVLTVLATRQYLSWKGSVEIEKADEGVDGVERAAFWCSRARATSRSGGSSMVPLVL